MTTRPWLRIATAAYGVASFMHFLHNAVYLDHYPNLPEDWTGASVMASWLPIGALGVVGTVLHRRGRAWGLVLLAAFGATGYAGLLHYALAPLAAHSAMMNATIFLESLTGTALLVFIVRARRRASPA